MKKEAQTTEKLLEKKECLIGVISDTHGMLRPEVREMFKDVDAILHAGDIDNPETLNAIRNIAPVIAVRGNMDHGAWAANLPAKETVRAGNVIFYMMHDLHRLDLDPPAAGFAAVISGHTHRPSLLEKDGVLYLNPGSAGFRRKDYPISAALLKISDMVLEARIIDLISHETIAG